MTLLSLQNAGVRLGHTDVLHNIDVDIQKGEIITIVGPNGSGKSTLLRALIGAVPLTSGRVTRSTSLQIGYVPQKLFIDPNMPLSVLRFLQLPQAAPAPKIDRALEMAGASALLNRMLSTLSGGQFQRVLLARAILHTPQLLLLDEATQGLDQPSSALFYQTIEKLRHELGCAVVMASHELHVVMSASDRVICLNGHICCQGRPETVVDAPEYRKLFGTGSKGALALYRHEHTHKHT